MSSHSPSTVTTTSSCCAGTIACSADCNDNSNHSRAWGAQQNTPSVQVDAARVIQMCCRCRQADHCCCIICLFTSQSLRALMQSGDALSRHIAPIWSPSHVQLFAWISHTERQGYFNCAPQPWNMTWGRDGPGGGGMNMAMCSQPLSLTSCAALSYRCVPAGDWPHCIHCVLRHRGTTCNMCSKRGGF